MAAQTLLSTLRTNRKLPETEFLRLLPSPGKYKDRSNSTHDEVHLPLLTTYPTQPIMLLLLGTSMLERFQTTGTRTSVGSLSFPTLFNAGCGGDCIKHVVFRLGTKDLYSLLRPRNIHFIWLQMGTNDLTSKRGLRGQMIELYGLVLEACRRMAPKAVVFVGGIMPRRDVMESIVQGSNERLAGLVEEFNRLDEDMKRVHFVPPNPGIGLDCLVDHVHLDETGYEMFSSTIEESLREAGMEIGRLTKPQNCPT